MSKVLITGSQGFIGTYICNDLLTHGYKVTGVDNFSKYGPIVRPHDNRENFKLHVEDVIGIEERDIERFKDVEYIIANAALIGGITYFHKYAYDLLAKNERIIASTFDLALKLKKVGSLKRIVVLSSSMVYENTTTYPSSEDSLTKIPPPSSTYGFQKLSCEYFCKGAWEQYGLPYTIVRPFNCVGVGEEKALGEEYVTSGNIKLMMSHVLPDIVNKCLEGQYPLHILGSGNQVRCYTNGKDIARAIRLILESEVSVNNDYNISIDRATTVAQLANSVWKELGYEKELQLVNDDPCTYDVQNRIPDVSKAQKDLGFFAEIPLEESIREVVQWFSERKEK